MDISLATCIELHLLAGTHPLAGVQQRSLKRHTLVDVFYATSEIEGCAALMILHISLAHKTAAADM